MTTNKVESNEAQAKEDLLLDLYKIHAYIPNDSVGNPLTPFGNFSEGYEVGYKSASHHYEQENTELKERLAKLECLEHDDELIIETLKSQKHKITTLKAQVNQLRDFANDCRDYFEELPDQAADNFYVKDTCKNMSGYANKVLAATEQQSMAEHDAEVIERCAKVCDTPNDDGYNRSYTQCIEAIRALKKVK